MEKSGGMAGGDEDVVGTLTKLRVSEDVDEREKCLDRIINYLNENENDDNWEDLSASLAQNGLLTDLYNILLHTTGVLTVKVLQVIAELAKTEALRQPCVDTGFVPVLLELLQSDDIDVKMQAGRGLGNICYENDEGRDCVGAKDGITVVLTLLQSLVKNEEPSIGKLRTIACGFLLNLTNTHEVLQEKAVSEGVFDILNEYLLLYQNECGLCNMVLLTISSFIENDECREKFCNSPLCSSIVQVLESEAGEVHQETLLDLLINISEWDEVKDALAETSLSNHLIRIIQSNTGKLDDRSQQTIKMASDLLVLLLTGEKSMETLFCKGEGPVFKETVKWLESDSLQLQLSSALAVGNFARKDENCVRLVEDGFIDRLLMFIKKHDNMETDITLQHAALSALRNLAIPVANKSVLLQSGVIEAVLRLMSSEVMAVIFKLLGVLRMLVDGQESAAIQLGMNKEFLSKLVEWCDVVEHAGVQGEASRLLAWLIKNGRSAELMRNISRADGIRHLVSMATSEHIVMQNEALVALTLIGATILADAALQLKQADLIDTITTLLQNENTIPEILCNTLVLTKTIIAEASVSPQTISCSLFPSCTGLLSNMQRNLKEEIVSSGIADRTRQLTNHTEENVRNAAISLLSVLQELAVER